MDAFKNFASTQSQQDSAQQAQVWNLTSRAPSPLVLFVGPVVDITGDWKLLYEVSEATISTLQEILLANGTSGAIKFALAVVPPSAPAPMGTSFAQDYVVRIEEVDTHKSVRWEFDTGLRPLWKLYGFTDAGSGEFANMCVSGVEVPYQ